MLYILNFKAVRPKALPTPLRKIFGASLVNGFDIKRSFCIGRRFYGISQLIDGINRLINGIIRSINDLTRLINGWGPGQGPGARPPSH